MAKAFVTGKIANCRTVLQRVLRDHAQKLDEDALRRSVDDMSRSLQSLELNQSLDAVRGLEGDAAHIYFSVFDHLIVAQKESFTFQERNRRPPLDNVNCLLSFLYTLLVHDCRPRWNQWAWTRRWFSAPGSARKTSLALDLMEEFRPFLADRLALSLINLRQVQDKGFNKTEAGAVMMNDETRKTLLVAYQERKQEEIMHPFLDEKVTIGIAVSCSGIASGACLRGDLDGYPPFIWK